MPSPVSSRLDRHFRPCKLSAIEHFSSSKRSDRNGGETSHGTRRVTNMASNIPSSPSRVFKNIDPRLLLAETNTSTSADLGKEQTHRQQRETNPPQTSTMAGGESSQRGPNNRVFSGVPEGEAWRQQTTTRVSANRAAMTRDFNRYLSLDRERPTTSQPANRLLGTRVPPVEPQIEKPSANITTKANKDNDINAGICCKHCDGTGLVYPTPSPSTVDRSRSRSRTLTPGDAPSSPATIPRDKGKGKQIINTLSDKFGKVEIRDSSSGNEGTLKSGTNQQRCSSVVILSDDEDDVVIERSLSRSLSPDQNQPEDEEDAKYAWQLALASKQSKISAPSVERPGSSWKSASQNEQHDEMQDYQLAMALQEEEDAQARVRRSTSPPKSDRFNYTQLGGSKSHPATPRKTAKTISNVVSGGSSTSAAPQIPLQRPKPKSKPALVVDVSRFQRFSSFKLIGTTLTKNTNVELQDGTVQLDGKQLARGNFMRIDHFLHDPHSGKTYAVGEHFIRIRELSGILPRYAGELILLSDRCIVPTSSIVCKRRLIKTNLLEKEGREDHRTFVNPKTGVLVPHACNERDGLLLCRWKGELRNNVFGDTGKKRWGEEGALIRLSEEEADRDEEGYAVPDEEITRRWRNCIDDQGNRSGQQLQGGLPQNRKRRYSHDSSEAGPSLIQGMKRRALAEMEEGSRTTISQPSNLSSEFPRRRAIIDLERIYNDEQPVLEKAYTFGDLFCGGGGVSQGARQARLKIKFGVDMDERAISTWKLNHGMSKGYHMDVNKFVTKSAYDALVDILHLSPPCQVFSWCKTNPGKNDDENSASFLCVTESLKKCRPRAVTCEETDALLALPDSENEGGRMNFSFFAALINSFTSQNYSIRWKVLDGRDFGVCCKRKRLILIASCPGETPAYHPIRTHTHKAADGAECPLTGRFLLPTPTIRQTISDIPRSASHHDTADESAEVLSKMTEAPKYDEHFQGTMVCSGASGKWQFHPSGKRRFTPRELGCIMSFPVDYLFGTDHRVSHVRKIVGNAVPPKLAECWFRRVIKHLRFLDRQKVDKAREKALAVARRDR